MTKNYYYAQKEEPRKNPKTGKMELYLLVPILVEPDTDEAFEKDIRLVKIGGMHLPCFYDWIPESYYLTHKRDLESASKREERSQRCLIPNGEGGWIMCPECHRCSECEKWHSFKFDNGHATSIDALQNTDSDLEKKSFEPASDSATPEEAFMEKDMAGVWEAVSETIISRLADKKPKYGLIFQELLKGVLKPSDIARNAGLKVNRTCEDLPKVQKLAAEILISIKAELGI